MMNWKTKSCALALLSLALSASAFADNLDSWTYFNGASRTVQSTGGWIQLESSDKNYCNGRVRLYKDDSETLANLLNPSYILEVQGSWCKVVKFGFRVDGNNYEQTDSTQRFALSKTDGDDDTWSGYGGDFTIPEAALFNMSNGVSPNQMSMVLYTDSRDDTHRQAYEKLTIDLGGSLHQDPSSSTDATACINNAKSFVANKYGVSLSEVSADNAHISHKNNYVYDVHVEGVTILVTTNQSCQVIANRRID